MVDDAISFVLLYLNASVYLSPLLRYGRLKFFLEGSSRNRGWSSVGRSLVVNITLISYTFPRYVRNVAHEE